MTANEDFILELLIKHGLIQPSDLEDARRAADHEGIGVVEQLVHSGLVTDLDILRTTAAEAGVEIQEKIELVPDEAVRCVPRQLAFRLAVMPLNIEGRHLRVALADPFNFDAIDTLSKELVRYDIEPVVAPQDQIEQALKRHYGNTSEMVGALIGDGSDQLQVKTASDAGGEGGRANPAAASAGAGAAASAAADDGWRAGGADAVANAGRARRDGAGCDAGNGRRAAVIITSVVDIFMSTGGG